MKKNIYAFIAANLIFVGVGLGQTTTAQIYTPNGTTVLPTQNNTGGTSGNVGIGINIPQAKLDILSPNNAIQLRLRPVGLAYPAAANSPSIPSVFDMYSTFDNVGTSLLDQGPRRTAAIKAFYKGGAYTKEVLAFLVGGSNDAGSVEPTEQMRIQANGNVGIGNSTPATLLDLKTLGKDAVIRIGGTPASSQVSSSLELGYYTGAIFTKMGSVGFSNFPAAGSGQFKLSNGNAYISMNGSQIGFNEDVPLGATPDARYGNFTFNALVGMRSLLVGNYSAYAYPGGTPDISLLTGYIFGVNGNSYTNGSMVIGGRPTTGTTGLFPQGFPSAYKLFVTGGILTEKVKCALASSADWKDYVLAPDYKLKSLTEVESFIKTNQHLPNVPSANELVKSGIDLVKMDATLLEKIEELTLYVIQLKKENEKILKDMEALKASK